MQREVLPLTPKRLVVYADVEDGDDGDEENVSRRFVLSSLSGCSRHIKCDLSVLEENCFAGSLFSQGFTPISSFGSLAALNAGTLGDGWQNIYFPRHTLPLRWGASDK